MVAELDPIIKECLKDGRMSVAEMLDKLYPNLPSWDRTDKRNRLATRCGKLCKDGDLIKREIDGVVYWELVTS